MDCFKFAGVLTGQLLESSRQNWYKEIRDFESRLLNSYLNEGEKRSFQDEIQDRLRLIHTYQEPWILNANLAREIVF